MAQTPRKKGPDPTLDPALDSAPDPARDSDRDGTEGPAPGQATVADILSGKASGVVGGDTGLAASPADQLHEFKDMLSEQRERQDRLRHVQQFLTSPLFVEMRDRPVTVSEDRHAIEERKRDLDYRIRVLESLVAILIEERDFLDKVRPEAETPPETDAAETDADAGHAEEPGPGAAAGGTTG